MNKMFELLVKTYDTNKKPSIETISRSFENSSKHLQICVFIDNQLLSPDGQHRIDYSLFTFGLKTVGK